MAGGNEVTVRRIDYPFGFDASGRTARAETNEHIRDMIYQVLFTNPGERVNRPDFGCGLLRLLFEPNSGILADSTEYLVHGSLQRWLGDVLVIRDVSVTRSEEELQVLVVYEQLETGELMQTSFTASPDAGGGIGA